MNIQKQIADIKEIYDPVIKDIRSKEPYHAPEQFAFTINLMHYLVLLSELEKASKSADHWHDLYIDTQKEWAKCDKEYNQALMDEYGVVNSRPLPNYCEDYNAVIPVDDPKYNINEHIKLREILSNQWFYHNTPRDTTKALLKLVKDECKHDERSIYCHETGQTVCECGEILKDKE